MQQKIAPAKNLNLIQLLRGVASMLVVLMHATININENYSQPLFGNIFTFGGAGVDIFFVLSGFIITYSTKKSLVLTSNFTRFLKRRFVRIFPTYWIVITSLLIIQFVLPSFFTTHYSFDLTNLLSTYFLLPQHQMVNGVSWTLTYELFFYFLFSIAFLVKKNETRIGLVAVYVGILLLFPIIYPDAEKSTIWINLIAFPMNMEFFMGILAAVCIPKLNARIAVPFIVSGVFLFVLAAAFSNAGNTILPNTYNRVILFGIPSFFIITGLVKYETTKVVKMHSVLISLGEASYSLYLIHLPVIIGAIKLFGKLSLHTSNLVVHIFMIGVLTLVSIGSILFFKWIERPLIKKLNKVIKA